MEGRNVCSDGSVECTEGVGRPKLLGKKGRTTPKFISTRTWAPCHMSLFLLSAGFKPRLGVLLTALSTVKQKHTEMLLPFCN